MAPPNSTLFRIANEKLAGGLAERIAELRADDRSWRWIARQLKDEVGFEVTAETLRQWGEALGVSERSATEPAPEAAAS